MCVIVVVDQCPVGSERGRVQVGTELLLSPTQEGRQWNNIFPDGLGNN